MRCYLLVGVRITAGIRRMLIHVALCGSDGSKIQS